MSIRSFDSSVQLIDSAVSDFESLANKLLASKPQIKVLLTGGTLGIEFVAGMSKCNLDFSRIWLMFSDERFVGLEDSDRNEYQAISAWPELAEHLTRFPGNDIGLEDARGVVENSFVAEFGPIEDSSAVFDLTILGMGPDAHVASLFPGHNAQGDWVIAEFDSPKPPSERLSLSYAAINRSERIWFLAAGDSKAWAVAQSLDQNSGMPAARVRGVLDTVWYLDQEITGAL